MNEHTCKENQMHGTAYESKVYTKDGEWWLSLDCGCCHTEINYCPFCGIKLTEKTVTQKTEYLVNYYECITHLRAAPGVSWDEKGDTFSKVMIKEQLTALLNEEESRQLWGKRYVVDSIQELR
jgi:hypothetical protein